MCIWYWNTQQTLQYSLQWELMDITVFVRRTYNLKKVLHLYFPHFSSNRQAPSCKHCLYCNWIQPKWLCTRDCAKYFNNLSALQLFTLYLVLGSCPQMSVTHLLVGNSAFKSKFYYILTLCASVLMLQKIGFCQDWMHPTCSNFVFMWIWPLIHKIPV